MAVLRKGPKPTLKLEAVSEIKDKGCLYLTFSRGMFVSSRV